VPTIPIPALMVGTAHPRLCPPYKFDFQTALTSVIASVSEAIHGAAKQEWIASSLTLLAMTWIQIRDPAARFRPSWSKRFAF
jgi:hypothetical protein